MWISDIIFSYAIPIAKLRKRIGIDKENGEKMKRKGDAGVASERGIRSEGTYALKVCILRSEVGHWVFDYYFFLISFAQRLKNRYLCKVNAWTIHFKTTKPTI